MLNVADQKISSDYVSNFFDYINFSHNGQLKAIL